MGITDRFCPKCGQLSEGEGLCSRCRAGTTQWLSCDQRVQSVHCPGCGAQKQASVWTDTGRDRSDLAYELARNAVHLHPDLKSAHSAITVDDLSTNRSRARISVSGLLYDRPVEGTCEVTIAWVKEQCDRCNRISGSYYEGVVQVRAQDRIPTLYEIQTAASLATGVEEMFQTGGERLSFISDMAETRDGLDIIIGSQHIGLAIAKKITTELGGRFSTHPKLVGEKNGRRLYRITYSVRLPRYQKQDIIRVKGRYGEVIQIEPHYLRIFDFADGTIRAVRDDEVEKLVGNARDAQDAIVAYAEKGIVGILDPASFLTRESRVGPDQTYQAGQHVQVLRDGEALVILR